MKYIILILAGALASITAEAGGPGKNTYQGCKRIDDYTIECRTDSSNLNTSTPEEVKKAFRETGAVVSEEEYRLDQFHGITFPQGNKSQELDYSIQIKKENK